MSLSADVQLPDAVGTDTRASNDEILFALTQINVRRVVWAHSLEAKPGVAIEVGLRAPNGAPPDVLSLSNKGLFASVTRMALAIDDDTLSRWAGFGTDNHPQAVLDRTLLVVDDASPDSVFGTLLVLMRLAGGRPQDISAMWLDSVERWELEGMVEQPLREWPSLASALSHASFPIDQPGSDTQLAAAWTASMRFAAECLLARYHPAALPDRPSAGLHHNAQVALRQEEQTYHDWLPHAHVVQLSLPLDNGEQRRLLVDGLLFVEDQPTGTAKVIYRNDRRNAPLHQGFCLAASYRPGAAAGSGNEFTIAIDTRRGVVLDELQEELDRRETEAWRNVGMDRPTWKPRRDMARLPDTPWNQPWYITDNGSLIAAPKQILDDRQKPEVIVSDSGTKLTWNDVQEAIWAVCSPLRDVMVEVPPGDAPVRLLELGAHAEIKHGKSLLLARWPSKHRPDMRTVRSLVSAPVVNRALAGLIGSSGEHRASLASLPASKSLEHEGLSGGFAIATQKGLLVLDDWREFLRLDFSAIQGALEQAARLDEELSRLERDRLGRLTKQLDETLRSKPPREQRAMVMQAAHVMAELARLRGVTATVPRDADARKVRQLLDRVWGLDARLANAEIRTKGVADALKAVGDARLRSVTQFVALVGFPFYFATGLATPVGKVAASIGWGSLSGTDPSFGTWFACFAAMFLAGGLIAWVYTRGGELRSKSKLR